MTGKHQIEIGPEQFISGMGISADTHDGGFSPETDAVNLLAAPGVLYSPTVSVDSDTDTRLTGNLIASCPDMNTVAAYKRLFISDDGKGYRYDGTKLNAAGVALTAGKTWAAGFSDIITFLGEAFATSKEGITRWDNADTIDAGADFPFSFTTATVPHPALVYENNAYYADKNLLLQQTAVGTAPTTILTLDASQIIIALGIDPASGLMLISTVNTLDMSGSLIPNICKLLWYDGNSAKVSKSAIIDSPILGFQTVASTVYLGCGGPFIGYLSGSGIQFLRKLTATSTTTQLPYKHHLANIENTFYVLDQAQILAFGEVLPGRKIWYPAWTNNVNSSKPTILASVGSKKLGVGFATTKFYTFDTSSNSTADLSNMYSRKFLFPRPVFIRSFYVEYADAVADNQTARTFSYRTDTTAMTSIPNALSNLSGAVVYSFPDIVGHLTDRVRWIQVKHAYGASSANYGLKRIIIYYDIAE